MLLLELAITLLCVMLCVGVHMTAMRKLWLQVLKSPHASLQRFGTFRLVLTCMMAHMLEIMIFAAGFACIAPLDGVEWEKLKWHTDGRLEIWYYSASFYTSLGSANPETPGFRMMAGFEALTGLILVAWTASFLYLVMSRTWEGHPQ